MTAAQLRELAALLVDIHGQNDGRQLMDERRHMEYLDRFGNHRDLLEEFKAEYRKYNGIKKEISGLDMDRVEKERLSESLRYQIEELERAAVKAGERESLSARRDLLRNSEKLTEALDQAFAALYGGDENAVSLAQNAGYYAGRAAGMAPELESAAAAINDAAFSLTDAAETPSGFQGESGLLPGGV